MDGFVIDRADGRADGEDWTEDYEELPGDASISIILEWLEFTTGGIDHLYSQAARSLRPV